MTFFILLAPRPHSPFRIDQKQSTSTLVINFLFQLHLRRYNQYRTKMLLCRIAVLLGLIQVTLTMMNYYLIFYNINFDVNMYIFSFIMSINLYREFVYQVSIACHWVQVYKIDETVADPVNSSFWRSNFYIIPGRPPGNDYIPPLLPKSGKSMQLIES